MKILVAPDKFKGILAAREVADAIASGIAEELPSADVEVQPVADGGEGTAEVLCAALHGTWKNVTAHDARGHPCPARYAWFEKARRAVFEMSEVAGVRALGGENLDLDQATTCGVGEILLEAAGLGAREIVVGLGGSVTNDGGFGMARALGFEFLAGNGEVLLPEVGSLTKLSRVRSSRNAFDKVRIIAAADVMNPLLGPEGATRVFAAQKGARREQIESLEKALTNFADVVERDLDVRFRDSPGAGAAGGLGFGLLCFCTAGMRSGFQVVAESVDLESRIAAADVVVTGEGRLDKQTLAGKAPGQVAKMSCALGKRVFAVVGRNDADAEVGAMFEDIFEVAREGRIDAEQIRRAPDLLRGGGRALAQHLAGRG